HEFGQRFLHSLSLIRVRRVSVISLVESWPGCFVMSSRNQRALIKTLEIQIGHMSKVLKERGFESLPSSTKMNLKDHVKLISTAKANSNGIRRIESEARKLNILETYSIGTTLHDNTLSQNEKDPGSFTLLCFIHNVCFDKPLVDLGASVSAMPFSTYYNLGLGDLAHTRLTVELNDRTTKHPMGINENVLVKTGKFIFPIDFIILDIPEDDYVPLILERPFLSTTHAKIDFFKIKITLSVGEEKIVFKSIKPATSIIRRVYMLKERTNIDSKTNLIEGAVNKSFDPHYGDDIKLYDLNMPLESRINQDNNFEPTIDESIIVNKPTNKCHRMKFSCMIGHTHVIVDFLSILSINMITKHFYNSIIKDKHDHEGKKLARTLIDVPIFVRNFSDYFRFTVIDDMDGTSRVVLGMSFFKKFVSCQKIMEKFTHGDKYEQIKDE
nr:hypothetical protein [Tanacetum cinerariifolium]